MGGITRSSGAKYHCRTYNQAGSASCYHNTIDEAPLVGLYRPQDPRAVSCRSSALDRLRRTLEAAQDRSKPRPGDLARLRREIDVLDGKIDQGAERVLEAPAEIVPALYRKLEEYRSETGAAQGGARRSGKPTGETGPKRRLGDRPSDRGSQEPRGGSQGSRSGGHPKPPLLVRLQDRVAFRSRENAAGRRILSRHDLRPTGRRRHERKRSQQYPLEHNRTVFSGDVPASTHAPTGEFWCWIVDQSARSESAAIRHTENRTLGDTGRSARL